jgi:hypothetical protein
MTRPIRTLALAAGFVAVLAGTASAQLAIGLTGGVNSATLTGSDADEINVDSKTGGAGGAYANIYLGKRFSAEGQLLFQGQGFQGTDTDNAEYDVAQGYIVVPMLLKVYFGKLNIFAGPAVSWEVSCSVNADNTAGECDSSQTGLWSGIAGLGIQFGRLGAEVHYQSGFSDTFEDVNATYGVWSLMGRFAILGSR